MFIHYIKIAFRNMQKQKMYSIINIGGFAIGIAACLLIALYIQHETSYDADNPNKDRVYRIVGEATMDGVKSSGVGFPAPMAKALLNDFPELEKAGRLMSNELFGGANNQVRREDQQNNTYETGFCFADTSMLDILNIHMIYGDKQHALSEPSSVVLCKSMADKYFPHQNPVGKTMIFDDHIPVKIGGVMKDFPSNSHLQYRGFISLSGLSFGDNEQQNWNQSNYDIYLQLRPHANVNELNKKITADIIDKYMIPAQKSIGRKNPEAFWKNAHLYLQPLTDIHLYSYDIKQDDVQHGDIRFIYLFAAIAAFILILACINFLNLSTARSANRAKEVGLRKVIGSSRKSLIKQFLTESMLYSFLSFFIGLIIAVCLLPVFNRILGTQLFIPWHAWWLLPLLMASAFIIGLTAGLYPAFYLSYFKPVNTLKGHLSLGSKNSGLRSTLVVFQFTVSIVLLISTSVVYRQMRYILNSKTGFNKDEVVMIQGADVLRSQSPSFKNELLKLPVVKNVSVSDYLPVAGTKRNGNTFTVQNPKPGFQEQVKGQFWRIDNDYINTLGMQLIAGRNFRTDMPTDSQACIINKAMADQLGFENPVGKIISNGRSNTIIGVVDNFYYESMKQRVEPLCMVLGDNGSNSIISVKINAANMKDALTAIQKVWKEFVPKQSMRYGFLDERYASMYEDVQHMQYIFTGFSILAIIIACLGLFALAAFMAEQRTREIGIRKILGASVSSLFKLLTANFVKLVCVSLLIAIPLGWMLMNKWLQDYTYRIGVTWDIFVIAGVIVLFIALLTICFQAIKVAVANPTKNLRTE